MTCPLFFAISDQNDGDKIIGYTYHIDDFIINQSGEKKTLYFYVVPKNRLDLAKPHNVKAQVFLTKYPNDKFVLNPGFKYKGCKEEDLLKAKPKKKISLISMKSTFKT